MTPEYWEEIGRLYDAAKKLTPDVRGEFLARECHADVDLRRDVESLLAAEAYVGDFREGGEAGHETWLHGARRETSPRARIGSSVGPYQIYEFIGAGGMGEVFAATDLRLGRKVAIKILSPTVGQDHERVQRFILEARTASRLNHPNILTIHDFGDFEEPVADGSVSAPYIVSELLEGETLRERLNVAPLPATRAIEIAIQIAQGLAAAHELGIIHRDLKPENLFITQDGRTKVLDFGLAKLLDPPLGRRIAGGQSRSGIDASPILTDPIHTDSGRIIGTVNYMAPEQLCGEETDQRADIFALGVILFEMVMGRRPFGGDSAAETISAILRSEMPEVERLGGGAAAGLERVIRRCLAKSPSLRFQSMSDLVFALEGLLSPGTMSVSASAERSWILSNGANGARGKWITSRLPAWSGWIAAAIFMTTTLMLAIVWWRQPNTYPRVVPFTSFPGQKSRPVFSPDGNQIAFYWEGEDGRAPGIYVKLIYADTPLRLIALEDTRDPSFAWSPDGRSIAFGRRGAQGGIFTIPALGGPERKLTDLNGEFDWSPDGRTLAIVRRETASLTSGITLLSLETGVTRALTLPPADFYGDRAPAWSPDGKSIAFIRSPNYLVSDVYLIAAAGGSPTRLTFDNLEIPGSLCWTANGKEILFTSPRGGLSGLWRVSASGGGTRREFGFGEYAYEPSASRRGERLAYVYRRHDRNIWRIAGPHPASPSRHTGSSGDDSHEHSPVRLIASTREEVSPQISPDNERIVFVSDRSGSREIWVSSIRGEDAVQLTNFGGSVTGSPRWSPDGRQIVFDSRAEGRTDIFIVSADGGRPRRLTTESSEDVLPSWSSDGRSIYFGSRRNGEWQIWKIPTEGGVEIQVTVNGGYEAFESGDGRYIYYSKRDPVNEPGIWRIPIAGGPESRVLERGGWGYWSLADDGICLIDSVAGGGKAIEFFDFATREFTILERFERTKAPAGPPGISISHDGHWVYYWQADQVEDDIMLVENFR
jgi:eukaryotic-like serine/threonine-protein kinase